MKNWEKQKQQKNKRENLQFCSDFEDFWGVDAREKINSFDFNTEEIPFYL